MHDVSAKRSPEIAEEFDTLSAGCIELSRLMTFALWNKNCKMVSAYPRAAGRLIGLITNDYCIIYITILLLVRFCQRGLLQKRN